MFKARTRDYGSYGTLGVLKTAMEANLDRSSLHLFVIDDDDDLREAVKDELEEHYGRVDGFESAHDALRALRAGSHPDVILLDLRMPAMNGWEMRVEMKRDPVLATIPVVIMTGDPSSQAAAIDAAAHLRKPVDERSLLETIDRVASQLERSRRLAHATELERLLSLGALLGGIAHEINNPLALVLGNLDLLQRQVLRLAQPAREPEPFSVASALRALERTREGTERIAAVVRSASMFASADLEGISAIDVHEVLESSIQVASNEIRHGAHLVRAYDGVPYVHGNPAKLGQVFLNLLLHALHAIRERGGQDHVIRVSTAMQRNTVVISIADSASEVDAARFQAVAMPLSSSFDPGTRLHFGLAVSREVVQEMGGRIEVESRDPSGAEFRVVLPCATRTSLPPPAPKTPVRVSPERSAVLIIDDESMMCELLAAMIGDDYTVAAFTSPRAALAALVDGDYAAVLCDVMMPELNGMELYDRAVRERPELAERFIFITGGAFTDRARLFLKQTGRPVLRKPCTQRELLEMVGSVAVTAV